MYLTYLYRALWWLIAPLAVVRLAWRARREPGYLSHLSERFGYAKVQPLTTHQPLIWLHAVSVGETYAAQPLVDALMAAQPHAQLLLTHTTPAGRATSEALFGGRVLRCYLPYDLLPAVRRFLKHYQPVLGIVMETEVWPTLLSECQRAGVPMVLANARMSERSSQRYLRTFKLGRLMRDAFAAFSEVLAQSAADATRLRTLGARHVTVVGNLKFDISVPSALLERGQVWRSALGKRPVWVAASTRAGEEELVLEAFKRSGCNDALLILVPRHPSRFDEVAAQLERTGWRFMRRSSWRASASSDQPQQTNIAQVNAIHANDLPGAPLAAEVQVLLGDSMGELSAYYAASDLAFIGGSLLPFGGHNLIEACTVGVPVLIGPHTFNFTQATADAISAGAALRVVDSAALAQALRRLSDDTRSCAAMRAAAIDFAAAHRGATENTVKVLIELLKTHSTSS